ncbi:BIG1 [Symbiodinium sp. CCMP2456]|nr:BIG1 [Symbiodinium sp. CCMP2456]
MDEHRSVVCPLGEAGKVLDVALSCRVQAVCVVLLLLILGLLCSCLWRRTSQTCHKARVSVPERRSAGRELEFDAVPSGLSKSEASTQGSGPGLGADAEAQNGGLAEGELPKMASRYSIKSAFSRWTRAKAKVRVVWKLNLLQVQNWLNGKGEAPHQELQVDARQDLEAGDADGEQDLQNGDDGEQVPQERGSLDDPMPPRASAAVGFLAPQGPQGLEALPAYADGDRVEYFSPTCGLWLLGEVTVTSDAKRSAAELATCMTRCAHLTKVAELVHASLPPEAPSFRDVLDQVRAEALEGGLQLPPRVTEEDGEGEGEDAAARCREALLLLSNLCEQSVEEPNQVEKQRHLALLLTAKLLESCESTELSSKPFIAAVRRFFSVSLTRNSLSSGLKMTKLALRLVVLVSKLFGESLSYELGVFLDQIVLPVLVSGNSSYAQKHWMLQVSQTLFGEAASAVLAVFLIFDCDLQKRNVLERMIESLSRIATGKYTSSEHASVIQPEQEHRLRILALGALLTLVKSLEVKAQGHMTPPRGSSGTGLGASWQEPPLEDDEEGEELRTRSATAALDQKRLKRELQEGVSKFNLKPKRGLEHLKRAGLVENEDPGSLAKLFRNTEIGLDKTTIGDYLGEDKAFNKRVLDALLESFDFAKQEFDEALRAFLAVFRLPGEGQKIDRLMQHFAAKYCKDNPGRFSDEDCVYVLAYSVMMLQTSLHKPSIKEKDRMTKAQFISNNRGIDGGKDLPQEYLEALYDIVLKSPFSLQEDEDARGRAESQAARSAAQKGELFLREAWKLVAKAEETMASEGETSRSLSLRGADVRSLARTLFEAACWPMLASLSVVLETQEEPECIELCITGFQQCIRAAARMQMDVERDAIVSSLAKFTYLTTLKEMRQKNIECIRVLMAIGISEGNNLGSSWQYVLHCISQLERLQLLRTRALQDFQFFAKEAKSGSTNGSFSGGTPQASLRHRSYGTGFSAVMTVSLEESRLDLLNAESVMAQIDAAQIDLLFDRSAGLELKAVLHFLSQLIQVSKEELACEEMPRIFSLQKLVEVAIGNLMRPPEVWSEIWRTVSRHLADVASHHNVSIGLYAINCLKQLAMKFLEREEVHQQETFGQVLLEPFEKLMKSKSASPDVKGLVVSSVDFMVEHRSSSIKAGWAQVFQILQLAASEPKSNKEVLDAAFAIMKIAVASRCHLDKRNFAKSVHALLAFGHCRFPAISFQALGMLRQMADDLQSGSGTQTAETEDWLLLLNGMTSMIGDLRQEVSVRATVTAFQCLRDVGAKSFDAATWLKVIESVVEPVCEKVTGQLQQGAARGPRKPPHFLAINGGAFFLGILFSFFWIFLGFGA